MPTDPFDLQSKAAVDTVPRAPAFIVTLYGDVVAPRGGALWMGDVVACCAQHGINESLVRTAMSRLVAAGKLRGERVGRKSFYRLTEAAEAEFQTAARVLYAPPPLARGWLIAPGAQGPLPDGWAFLGSGLAIGPNRSDLPALPGLVLSAETVSTPQEWPALSRALWDLDLVADRYRSFLQRFEGLVDLAASADPGKAMPGERALALRLQLVHHYRHAALKDPRLPREAWPDGWPAETARQLFVRLYLALVNEADAFIGHGFRDIGGLLPHRTGATCLRCDRLLREAAGFA